MENKEQTLSSNRVACKKALYNSLRSCQPDNLDEVYFEFGLPDNGFMDWHVYVNGEKRIELELAESLGGELVLKEWLEEIVKRESVCVERRLDCEGPETIIGFEFLYNGYDYDLCVPVYGIGLFYIIDPCKRRPLLAVYCRARKLVSMVYMQLLVYSGKVPGHAQPDFSEWYFGLPPYDNWWFYNSIKSGAIELYIGGGWRSDDKIPVSETILMKPDENGIFHSTDSGRAVRVPGQCTHFVDEIRLNNDNQVFLSHVKGLKSWYNAWKRAQPNHPHPKALPENWYEHGFQLAKLVRDMLPPTVDLFYMSQPFKGFELPVEKEIPYMVP